MDKKISYLKNAEKFCSLGVSAISVMMITTLSSPFILSKTTVEPDIILIVGTLSTMIAIPCLAISKIADFLAKHTKEQEQRTIIERIREKFLSNKSELSIPSNK